MPINKVIYNGTVLIDTSGVTVTPDTLLSGITALNAKGELIVGTAEIGGGSSSGAVTDTGDGEIVIESLYSFAFADDGNGNLVGSTISGTTSTDDSGNVTMTQGG